MIRLARPADFPALAEIERLAGELFRDLGMDVVADDTPPTAAELAPYAAGGRAWVYAAGDVPVAYALVDVVDGHAHLEQVSVLPAHGRRGIGRELVEVVRGWARAQGFAELSLTTYAGVPWNGPYYERLGFEVVPAAELTEGLRAIRATEAAKGLDEWPRVVMRQRLGSGS